MSLPSLYLETTVVSYLVARPSRDVIVLAHQEITRQWWATRRRFNLYVSPVVLEECALGAPALASQRLLHLESIPVLAASPWVEQLAATYFQELRFPEKAIRDAAHLAFSCAYDVDYLVTWNCAHIANAEVRRQLDRLNHRLGVTTSTICTPEELLGRE